MVTTVGSYALPALLPFIPAERLKPFTQLFYAPIIQVCVGIRDARGLDFPLSVVWYPARNRNVCLESSSRHHASVGAPEGGALLLILHRRCPSYRLFAEERRRDSSDRIGSLPLDARKYPSDVQPDFIRIFRHQHAIPQYWSDSGERFRRSRNYKTNTRDWCWLVTCATVLVWVTASIKALRLLKHGNKI